MNQPALTEPLPLTASAAAATELLALAEHAPARARAALAATLGDLAPQDWAWLGLLHRGHAHSQTAALSRVLALAAARLGTDGIDPLDRPAHPATGVEVIEVPIEVEVADWVHRPVREDCYDLRLHAEPSLATDARRTTDAAIAARARRRPARRPVDATVLGEGTRIGSRDRLVA
ncbi:hypothetical protein [Nocardia noduli]|uniref:hypothetical protein n=1 Tax=Nocardia noduli TaxID=2815722 RepID=UPI001C242513|nr:hypothetical protein [Nocardia noduli]